MSTEQSRCVFKCNHCGKVLDFKQMLQRGVNKSTGEILYTHLYVALVVEYWPEKDENNRRDFRRELREISTDPQEAERVADYLRSKYEDEYERSERPSVRVETAFLNHLYGEGMFRAMT